MASAPSTPKPQTAATAVDSSSPGHWRHPRLKEIVRRQSAAYFGEHNIRTIALNAVCLVAIHFLASSFRQSLQYVQSSISIPTYPDTILLLIRAYLIFNILVALYPLYRPRDNFSDIPLTPSQRSLLGLNPDDTPPVTPGTKFSTPPRYRVSSASRTPTPFSTPMESPLPGRSISSALRASSDSIRVSPTPSPLFQRAMNNNKEESQRSALGSSAFGRSTSLGSSLGSSFASSSLRDSVFSQAPSTPTPSKVGPAMTNKWLYEKTRATVPTSSVLR